MIETEVKKNARIKLLTPEIASQIAAGEVIERPASVLKELLENSIDAEATQIEISLQHGGIQLISVRDNGLGIMQQDLRLALQQHATSKINNAHDLANITSLGFRGEALASISSVAKVKIISRVQDAESAWSIFDNQINPAAHPIGTTITVHDLFYNIPARRKFLRSERTEYQHLEEVFRRIALSNFDVAFKLSNQDKSVKNLPICNDSAAQARRVIALCGKNVMQYALRIDIEQNGLRLWGWLGAADAARSQEPHQYFYINRRVIKDRLISNAIRQVYQPLCKPGTMPFYCLYLELDATSLDVNVHPTKHEVRFRDPRIIHAFITESLNQSLNLDIDSKVSNQVMLYQNNISNRSDKYSEPLSHQYWWLLNNKIIFYKQNECLVLINIVETRNELLIQSMLHNHTAATLNTAQITHFNADIELNLDFYSWCAGFGFIVEQFGPRKVLFRGIPGALLPEKIDFDKLYKLLYLHWCNGSTSKDALFTEVAKVIDYTSELTSAQIAKLLQNYTASSKGVAWRSVEASELIDLIAS